LAEHRNLPISPTDTLLSISEDSLDDNVEDNESVVDSPAADLSTPQPTTPFQQRCKTKSTQTKPLNQNSRGKVRKPIVKQASGVHERRGEVGRENSGLSKRSTCPKIVRPMGTETEATKGGTGREAQRMRLGDVTNQVVKT